MNDIDRLTGTLRAISKSLKDIDSTLLIGIIVHIFLMVVLVTAIVMGG